MLFYSFSFIFFIDRFYFSFIFFCNSFVGYAVVVFGLLSFICCSFYQSFLIGLADVLFLYSPFLYAIINNNHDRSNMSLNACPLSIDKNKHREEACRHCHRRCRRLSSISLWFFVIVVEI